MDTIVRMDRDSDGKEVAIVDADGVRLVCHHPREGIWCCCADEGDAMCCCGYTLAGAIKAWHKHEALGE